eukprot:sb/3473997/
MVNMSRLQTPEASDPFYRVKKELKNLHPSARLRYSSQFAKETHQRSSLSRAQSCPAGGIDVDEINEFKLELVRRHNPHARRVCHIKGLNDVPVCVVRDELNTDWENRLNFGASSHLSASASAQASFSRATCASCKGDCVTKVN